MLLSDLILQTKSFLPLFTEKFTDNIDITTVSKSGDDVTITTSSAHGLSVSEEVLISGIKTEVPITTLTTSIPVTSITRAGLTVTVTTTSDHFLNTNDRVSISGADQSPYNGNFPITRTSNTSFIYRIGAQPVTPATGTILLSSIDIAIATCPVDHDLTEGFVINIDIVSVDSAYDGSREIVSVPNSLVFTFKVSGSPSDSSGTLFTFFNKGFNGVQSVSDVVDTTNFKYVLQNDNLLAGSGSNMLLMTKPRVAGSASLSRAIATYTSMATDKLCGFFVFEGMTTSSDRSINNDSKNERTPTDEFKLRLINDVTFYVFIPTQNQISARDSVDVAQELARAVYKTLAAYKPVNVFTTEQQTVLVPSAHGVVDTENVTPFLIYGYDFQNTEFLLSIGSTGDNDDFMSDTGDTFPLVNTRAFRKFNWKSVNEFGEIVKDDNFDI